MKELFELIGEVALEGTEALVHELNQMDDKASEFGKSLDRVGKRAEKMGKAMTTYVTLPIVAMGAAVVKVGADFEAAMTESLAIMGDVGEKTRKEMEEQARSVAVNTKFSAKEAAESYFYLASAGLDAKESMEALNRVAQFAQAGNFDMAKATDLLTDAQSALGLSVENTTENMKNMERVSDVLVKANTKANATVQQFSESLTNRAGAALRDLNKDVEEGVAVLAVFADQGRKGAEAGTALDIVLRDLQKSAQDNEEAFDNANITVYDANGNMRNMADIVEDLENRFKGMSDKQKRAELTNLGFQEESLQTIKALLGTSDAIRDYEEALRSSAGITEEVAEKQMQDFWSQVGLLKDQLIELGLVLWEVLGPMMKEVVLPALQSIIDGLSKVVNWFKGLPEPVQKVILILTALVAAIGPVLFAFSKVLAVVKGLGIAIPIVKGALVILFALLKAHPIGILVTAIILLIKAGVELVQHYGGVGKAFNAVWKGVLDFFKMVLEKMVGFFKWYVETFVKIITFGGVQASFEEIWDGVYSYFKGTFDTMMGVINGFIDKVKAAIKAVKEFWDRGQKGAEAVTGKSPAPEPEPDDSGEGKKMPWMAKGGLVRKPTVLGAGEAGDELILPLDVGADMLADRMMDQMSMGGAMGGAVSDRSGTGARIKEAMDFEKAWEEKLHEQKATRMELLKEEKEEALEQAKALGASRVEILEYYGEKERQLRKQRIREIVDAGINVVNRLHGIWDSFMQSQIKRIDVEEERRKKALEHSQMSEQTKAHFIEKIEKESDEKRQELERKRAERKKDMAVFSAIINTAEAVSKALTLGPILGPIYAGILGALGLAEIIAIKSEPIPLAEGALVKKGKGVTAQIGEGEEDEVVFPLQTGIERMVDALIREVDLRAPQLSKNIYDPTRNIRTGEGRTPISPNRVPESSGGGTTENHWHVGVLVADEYGIKELERKMSKHRISENQRKGK